MILCIDFSTGLAIMAVLVGIATMAVTAYAFMAIFNYVTIDKKMSKLTSDALSSEQRIKLLENQSLEIQYLKKAIDINSDAVNKHLKGQFVCNSMDSIIAMVKHSEKSDNILTPLNLDIDNDTCKQKDGAG